MLEEALDSLLTAGQAPQRFGENGGAVWTIENGAPGNCAPRVTR